MKLSQDPHKAIAKLPDGPGVYFFRAGKKILYIGKAASLRDRVRSYFSPDLAYARSSAIAGMVNEARALTWRTTDSVLEALILEANLIKHHQPKYNAREKDNKSFNYLVITKESASRRTPVGGFPRVLVVRGRELFGARIDWKTQAVFGPYPQGRSLAEAMKLVRKIFPYRDKCIPCDASNNSLYAYSRELAYKPTRQRDKRICKPCFNRQIGLCPGVCSGEISKADYASTIRHITKLFKGNMMGLKRELAREMRAAAKAEQFEKAEELRRQIAALRHIRDVSLIKDEQMTSSGGPRVLGAVTRIEAYDVAHTAGAETVGVMTVVQDGEPEKASYRKFKIRTAKNDDIAALKEVLTRRLSHDEWLLPRVFVVDGGAAQLRAATRVLEDSGVFVPIVGVVKNEFHKPERLIGDAKSIKAYEKDILLANGEAHRFAVQYHRKRSRASMLW